MTDPLYTATMDETSMIQAFYDIEDKAARGYVFHVRQSQNQRVVGLTDVLAIVPPVVGFYELKTQRDRVSLRQRGVLNALEACRRVEVGIVRPHPRDGEMTLTEALRRLGLDIA